MLYVLLLLLSPVELPSSKDGTPEQWAALKQIARDAQLYSPGVTWIADFAAEIRIARGVLRNKLSVSFAAWHFGCPAAMAQAKYNLAFAHSRWCKDRWECNQREDLAEYWQRRSDDAERRQWAWWLLTERTECALKQLREMLGEEAWANGWMPEPVPLELFEEAE